eukprot:11225273-Lingulodinium_polyedra.AAC.1
MQTTPERKQRRGKEQTKERKQRKPRKRETKRLKREVMQRSVEYASTSRRVRAPMGTNANGST